MAYLIKNRIFSNEQVNPLPVQQKQVRCLMSDSRTRESTKGAGDETLINNSCLSSNGKEGSLKVHLLFSELIFVSDEKRRQSMCYTNRRAPFSAAALLQGVWLSRL